MSTKELILASNNNGKITEFGRLFAAQNIAIVPQGQRGVSEAEEPYETFLENALTKARHASRHTGLPAVADDSGICVPALGGAPGVYSARYANKFNGAPKSDAANNALLVEQLKPHADKRAYYYAVLVLVRHEHDPQPLIADGVWWGEVRDEPAGEGGFGYDPYFYLPDLGKTAAELSLEQKNQLSHRAQALRALLDKLKQHDL